MDGDAIVREYLRASMELLEQRGERPERSTLEAIARELGMTDEQIVQIQSAAREHRERGVHFLEHGLWDDAVRELNGAVALNPGDADTLADAAAAFAGRWETKKNEGDRDTARQLAMRAVDLRPNCEAAFAVLERLDPKTRKRSAPRNAGSFADAPDGTPGRGRKILFGLSAAVGGIIAAAAIFSDSSSDGLGAGRALPIALSAAAPLAGLTLQLDRCKIIPRDSVLCVQGDVTPAPGTPAREGIGMKLVIVDSNDAVISTDQFTARPCTTHVGAFHFHRDNPVSPRMKEVKLVAE